MAHHSTYFVTLLFVLFSTTSALIVQKQWFLKQGYVQEIQRFGFESEGEVKLTASVLPDPNGAFIFLCSSASFYGLLNTIDSAYSLCRQPSLCEAAFNLSQANWEFTVEHTDYYHFLLANCHETSEILVTGNLFLTNPNAGQLSRGDEQLPMVFGIAIGAWSTFALLWVVLWIIFRANSVALHGLMFTTILLKTSVVVLAFAYWDTLARTGYMIDVLRYVQTFAFAISETSFFVLLLLAAKGWRITRSQMTSSEARTILISVVLLMATLLFFSFYSEGYYFLSLLIMYFFMIPKIFGSLRRNNSALEHQIRVLTHRNAAEDQLLLLSKRVSIFRSLKRCVIVYLAGILAVNGLRIAIAWYRDYLNYVLDASLTLIINLWLAWLLLPSNSQVFAGTLLLERNQIQDDDLFGENASLLGSNNGEDLPEPVNMDDLVIFELPNANTVINDAATEFVGAYPVVVGIDQKSNDLSKFN